MKFAPVLGFTSASQSPIFSFGVGVAGQYAFNRHIYVQSGLGLHTMGHNRDFSFSNSDTLNASSEQKIRLYYIQAPLQLVFKSGASTGNRMYIGAGAQFQEMLAGTMWQHAQGVTGKVPFDHTETISLASGSGSWLLFDFGLLLSAGIETKKGVTVAVDYYIGYSDHGAATEIDKNRYICLKAGYFLKKKKTYKKDENELIEK